MNKLLLLLFMYPIIICGGCTSFGSHSSSAPPAKTTRYYDTNDKYKGYSIENGNRTIYYNTNTQRLGSSQKGK